jgi:RNA polymerase sigma factor (sigma-70 family)
MDHTALGLQDTEMVAHIERGGAAEAEAQLYEKYSARVYYLALSELRSVVDAEDVRAETFLRVLQSIRSGGLRTPQALAAFILGTAHNVIRELRRRQSKSTSLSDEELEEQTRGSYEPSFLNMDVERAVEKTIRRLKPREQAFLRMYYYEEMAKDEVSRRLGIKEERLRLVKSRALKSFREMYERLTRKS